MHFFFNYLFQTFEFNDAVIFLLNENIKNVGMFDHFAGNIGGVLKHPSLLVDNPYFNQAVDTPILKSKSKL